ncbi:MAG: hypothetical protein ACI8RZ_002493 [Myxococcota bacterium]|jgi:hypothetical protein
MHQGIEFRGRLSRSDRRPANPGQYDLIFQIFPKSGSRRMLWSETISGVEVRSGGFFDVILGQITPMAADLFAQSPRWLAVQVSRAGHPDGEHSPRVPLLGDGLRLQVQLSELSDRLKHLEDAFIEENAAGRSSRLRALPRRIQQIYSDIRRTQDRLTTLEGSEELVALVEEIATLAGGLARLSAPAGRLTRIEDELEDLIGPQGDVVDLNERMDALEHRTLVGDGAGAEALTGLLTTFQEEMGDLMGRQEKLERAIRHLAESEERQALLATYPITKPADVGSLVVIEGGTLILSRHAHDASVIGMILSSDTTEAVVAVGGLCACRVIGPVGVGDILVASPKPGVAAVADGSPLSGIALARALEPCGVGEGTIRVRII